MNISLDNDDDEYHRYRYRDPSAPKNQKKTPSLWCSKRFYVGFLLFLGYFLHGIVCQVPRITIEAMTTNRIISSQDQTVVQLKQFDWDSSTIEMLLNTFQTGFVFSLCGGLLAHKWGGSTTLGLSMMLTGSILLLNPKAVHTQFYLFLLSQGLVGLLQSFCLVSTAEIFACWVPKKERTAFMFCVTSGMYLGPACIHYFFHFRSIINNFPWQVYPEVIGLGCIIWSVVWLIFVKNEPLKDKRISEKELVHILQQTDTIMKKRNIKQFWNIMGSSPCWALFTAKYALGWASAFALSYLPLNFIKEMTNNIMENEIKESKMLIPIANTVNGFFVLFVGLLTAYWQSISHLKPTQFYKIIIGVSFTITAIFFIIITQFPNHFAVSIICLAVITSILSYSYVILEIIIINVAPNHTSILSGLTVFWQASGTEFVGTIIRFTVENHKLEEWHICFFSSAGTLVLCMVAFTFLGSSKPQPWSTIRHRGIDEGQHTRNTELINISIDS